MSQVQTKSGPLENRSLVDDFLAHVSDNTVVEWLSALIDGIVPNGIAVPESDRPVDYFIAQLRRRRTDESVAALGQAAGILLKRWLGENVPNRATPAALHRFGTILSVLTRAPSTADAADRLLRLCRDPSFRGLQSDIGDLRYEAILALAVCKLAQRSGKFVDFFSREIGDPSYAVAAFTGLRRANLDRAVRELPRFLKALREAGLPPAEPIWSLFAALENVPSEAQKLGSVLAKSSRLDELGEMVGDLLRTSVIREDFPRAWTDFERSYIAESLERLDQTGDVQGINLLLSILSDRLENTNKGSLDKATIRSNIAMLLISRYEVSHIGADLDSAIEAWEEGQNVGPVGSITWANTQTNYGAALIRRYERSGRAEDLALGIQALQEVLAQANSLSMSIGWKTAQANLGAALFRRFELKRNAPDLDQAIELMKNAIQGTPEKSSESLLRQIRLASMLRSRGEILANLRDLDAGIITLKKVEQKVSPESPIWPAVQSGLGSALGTRYRLRRNLDDLNQSISAFQKALTASHQRPQDKLTAEINFANCLGLRAELVGSKNDLNESEEAKLKKDLDDSVATLERGLDDLFAGSPVRFMVQANLSQALQRRYDALGQKDDLDRAVRVVDDTLTSLPSDSTERPALLNLRGGLLLRKHRLDREAGYLDRAVATYQEAIACAVNPVDASESRVNLGIVLRERLEAGLSEDRDEADRMFKDGFDRARSIANPSLRTLTMSRIAPFLPEALRSQIHDESMLEGVSPAQGIEVDASSLGFSRQVSDLGSGRPREVSPLLSERPNRTLVAA